MERQRHLKISCSSRVVFYVGSRRLSCVTFRLDPCMSYSLHERICLVLSKCDGTCGFMCMSLPKRCSCHRVCGLLFLLRVIVLILKLSCCVAKTKKSNHTKYLETIKTDHCASNMCFNKLSTNLTYT